MNMKENAVNRTPVEIWQNILRYAIAWDPIPAETDSNLQKIAFFIPGCKRYHQCVDAENTRRNIRLVCRSWEAAVKNLENHLIYIDASDQFWPSVDATLKSDSFEHLKLSRWESRMECDCGRNRIRIKVCRESMSPAVLRGSKILPQIDLDQGDLFPSFWRIVGLPRARVLLMEDFYIEPDSIFERAPNLKALSWTLWSVESISEIGEFRHDYLTHLRLTEVEPGQLSYIANRLNFPLLKHLELDLVEGECIEGDYLYPLSTWKLPNLTTLLVRADTTKFVKDDLEVMVLGCSRTLEIIIISIYVEEYNYGIPSPRFGGDKMWASLSHITLVGVSFEWLRGEGHMPTNFNAMPENEIPLTIYIHDFEIGDDDEIVNTASYAQNLIQWCNSLRRRVQRIAMQVSWLTLSRAKNVSNPEQWIVSLRTSFEQIISSGIAFCDKGGVTLGEKETPEFIEGMTKGYFDVGEHDLEDLDTYDLDYAGSNHDEFDEYEF